jgi:hypothetical protein
MIKDNNPFLTDEFLDEVVKEINQLYGDGTTEENDVPTENEDEK